MTSLNLPTNVRLGWIDLPEANSGLFCPIPSDEEKSAITLAIGVNLMKLVLFVTDGGAK